MNEGIKVAAYFSRHPKLNQLADSLGISRVAAMGGMVLLWIWAFEFFPSGKLPQDAADIAEAMDWKGDADALVESLVECGFLEETPCGYSLVQKYCKLNEEDTSDE